MAATTAVAALVAGGCSGGGDDGIEGDPADEGFVAVTTTIPSQDPCRFARVAEVEAAFGEAVSLDVVEGRCRYSFGGGAEVQVDIRPAGRPLPDLLPGAEPLPDLGEEAVWAPTPAGGTVAVPVDDEVLLVEVVLPDRPGDAQGLGFAVARTAQERMAADDRATEDVPGAGTLDPCALLDDEARAEVLGEGWTEAPSTDPAVCALVSPEGLQVLVGPLVRPATEAALAAVTRTGSEAVEWERTAVEVGDVGVLLTDPSEDGNVALAAVEGVESIEVEVRGDDGEQSRLLAGAVAEAVLAGRRPE